MNQSQLETLLAIVEQGSFEVAAAVLGISPSAVSQRVKALEKDAGRVLLRRATPVTPTEAGEVMVQTARRMALVQAEARNQLEELMQSVPLSVAVNADSMHSWFKPVIGHVAQMKNVALKIRVEDEAQTLVMLRRGDVVGAVTSEENPVTGCESTFLGSMRYLAVAAPHVEKRPWEEMPIVMYDSHDPVLFEALRQRGIDQHAVRGRTSIVPTIDGYNEAVRVGLGWGLVPQMQAQQWLDTGQLRVLDDAALDLKLYWQCWRLPSPTLEKLTQFVRDAAAVTLEQ